MHIVFLGLPGCGKGVQTKKLQELGYTHLSTGMVLREVTQKETPEAQSLKQQMNEGKLISDDVVNNLVLNFCKQRDNHKFLFDGYPRTLDQAKVLKDEQEVSHVFYLEISPETANQRMIKRNNEDGVRSDTDTEEKRRARIKEYFANTDPLIQYYQELGVLRRIDGENPIEHVAEQISTHLNKE